jgi:hypothetical protein
VWRGCVDAEQHPGKIRYRVAADRAGHKNGQSLLYRLPAGRAAGELHHGILGVESDGTASAAVTGGAARAAPSARAVRRHSERDQAVGLGSVAVVELPTRTSQRRATGWSTWLAPTP